MRSLLTEKLHERGFLCGIELEIYLQDTGRYTSLIIEGNKADDGIYRYDFYKQTFYPHYPNKVTVYGEEMSASTLLDRVDNYFTNRKLYLDELANKSNESNE